MVKPCVYYHDCSNYDPELTSTHFTSRSNLVTWAFVCENYRFIENFCNLRSKVGLTIQLNDIWRLNSIKGLSHSLDLVKGHSILKSELFLSKDVVFFKTKVHM